MTSRYHGTKISGSQLLYRELNYDIDGMNENGKKSIG